ncbi:hypothetical protein Tco_0688997 [Tanacetum coccineum]
MTKQGNFTQRTPQAKKQSDQASKQVSKQASGSTNAPHDLVFPATGPSLGTTQPTATITSTEDLQRVAFTTPPQTAPGTNSTEPPPPPIRNKGPELGADNLTLEGVATELAPSDFVSQNYETLVALMQEETKKRSSQSLQARLNFGPEDEVSPPRHRKERRREDNRRPPVFGRIGKQVSGTQTANLQNLSAHENNDWRISVHDRLGTRDAHSRALLENGTLGNPRTDTREDEDMSLPWRRQKVDAFTRRISDFSEDKRRRMPANVKTYDGTGDPDDHLKIFESAATIENWPQPVAFRLNFTQRKKCAKNPVELARISGFMNGINNPELIKRLNDRVPQTFDELMKRTRSFIQGETAAADSRKGYSNNRSQEQSRRQSNDKYTPLTMTPKEILATEGSNFPKPPPMRTPEEQRVGNGYCEYHRQKGHTTNECVQLRQLIDKLVKEGRLDHLVRNIKEGKDKQRSGGKKDAPRDKADTICAPSSGITDQSHQTGLSLNLMRRGRLQKWGHLAGNGSSMRDGSSAGLILTKHPTRREWNSLRHCVFNSQATEQRGGINKPLLAGHALAARMGVRKPRSYMWTPVLVKTNHVLCEILAKEDNHGSINLDKTKSLIQGMIDFTILASSLGVTTKKRIALTMLRCDGPIQAETNMLRESHAVQAVALPDHVLLVAKSPYGQGTTGLPCTANATERHDQEIYFAKWIEAKAVATITGKIRQIGAEENESKLARIYTKAAVITAEIKRLPTIRTAEVNLTTNDDERRIDLDILEERREQAAIREEKAKLKMKGYYDAKVRGVSFRPGLLYIVLMTHALAEDTRKPGTKVGRTLRGYVSTWKRTTSCVDMGWRELPTAQRNLQSQEMLSLVKCSLGICVLFL